MPLEVLDAVIEVFGSKKVGVKITPRSNYNDISESNPEALYEYLIGQLNKRGILFVDCVDEEYKKDTSYH